MTNHLATAIIKNSPPDVLIEISKQSCGTYDFYKAEELVEIGRYVAKEKLDSLILDSKPNLVNRQKQILQWA